MLAFSILTWTCVGIAAAFFLFMAVWIARESRRVARNFAHQNHAWGLTWRCDHKNDNIGELRETTAFKQVLLPGSKHLPQRPANTRRLGELGLPAIRDTRELLRWLGVDLAALLALANPGKRVRPGRSNYVEWTLKKKNRYGIRVICSPKPRLKAVQRKIKSEILDRAPLHDAAHGFIRTRSIASNAAPHVGRRLIVNLDLRNFFEHIRVGQVYGVFRYLGYGTEVARWLARLCTHSPQLGMAHRGPGGHWIMRRERRHAVQGAPTSPALANLVCLRLDRRLAGLARKFDATYTRYADDLTFSGDEKFKRGMKRFLSYTHTIVKTERFTENYVKRRFMRPGQRQQVTGVIVNQKLNTARDEFDRLKAIIHNAKKTGMAAQNRENHPDFRSYLLGRAAHIAQLNPQRGARLREAILALS